MEMQPHPGPGIEPVPSLGRAAGIAVRWNGAAALVTLVSQVAQVLFLARWLTPAEFGLAATVIGVTAFLAALSDLGLTNALVQRDSLTPRAWSGAWWVAAAAGIALTLLVMIGAPRLESALRVQGMTPLLWAAALSLPWAGPAAVWQAHLQRHLRLRSLAAVEIAAASLALCVVLAWVWWRRDAMALIAGQITLSIARFAGLGLASSLRPAFRPRWADLRPLAGFGGYQMAERIAAHALTNLDRVLVARFLGPAAAGYYFMASQIALKPAALLGPFTARTLLPLLARIRGDRARTASSYLRTLSLLSLTASAVYMLLIGLADPLLRLVLGPGWEPAVPALRLLAAAGFLLVLGNALGNLTLALGRAGTGFWLMLLVIAARFAAIVAGAPFGLRGVAGGLLLVTALSMIIDFILPRLWLGIGFRTLAGAGGWTLLPSAIAACAMIALSARLMLPALAEVLIAGAAGCVLFVLAAWLLHRERLRISFRELADKLGIGKTGVE